MDGGIAWNNNLASGVKECLKIDGIYSMSQIEIDIIVTRPDTLSNFTDKNIKKPDNKLVPLTL